MHSLCCCRSIVRKATFTTSIRANNDRHFRKPLITAEQAIANIKPGATILVGGFGLCGIPEKLLGALSGRSDIYNLSIVSNDSGTEDFGVGLLIKNGQVKKITASYIGENKECIQKYLSGEIKVELVPQGTIAESIRAGGAGIPFFYTKSGAGTIYENGKMITMYDRQGQPLQFIPRKETIEIDGQRYLREAARQADYSLIKAWKADTFGNLIFRETARNFNPVMTRAANTTLVEVEEIVPVGSINPGDVHVPGIYVDKLILGGHYEKRVMHLTVSPAGRDGGNDKEEGGGGGLLFGATYNKIGNDKGGNDQISKRERIAKRAAKEFKEGTYVNLGIGIPEHASNFIPKHMTVHIDSENGVLGLGPFPRPEGVDPDLINAGKETVTVLSGASYFGSEESFAMIRGGHFDMSMLGAFQVSQFGDLANWIIPGGETIKGMGGAMDLANSGSKIIITMTHLSKDGTPKILGECTLPLTAPRCVNRIITDLAVFDVDFERGLTLMEIAQGNSIESVRAATGCDFTTSESIGTF